MSATYLLGTDRQQSTLCGSGFAARAYSPYGALSATAGPAQGFAGHPPDPLTGHYHLGNGYRSYNPHLQRFNAPDSLSPFDKGGLNSYCYCLGDPVNYSDASGHEPEWLLPALAVAANLLGVFMTGMKMRSMYKVRKVHSPRAGYPASRTGVVSYGTPESPSSPAAGSEMAMSIVGGIASLAGVALGVARIAEPGKDWQSWGLAGLTGFSIFATGLEARRLYAAKPWQRYPIKALGLEKVVHTPRPSHDFLSARRPSAQSIRSR